MPKVGKNNVATLGATAMIVLAGTAYTASARTDSATGTTPSGQQNCQPGKGGRGADSTALATKLGVSKTDLDAAIKSVRDAETKPARGAERTADIAALATALDSDAATVKKAVESADPARAGRPDGAPQGDGPSGARPDAPTGTTPAPGGPRGDHDGGRGPGGPGGPLGGGRDQTALVAALVKATGKDEVTVKGALASVRTADQAERKTRDAKFAAALAAKLGLDQDKVAAAVESLRPTPPAAKAQATK